MNEFLIDRDIDPCKRKDSVFLFLKIIIKIDTRQDAFDPFACFHKIKFQMQQINFILA